MTLMYAYNAGIINEDLLLLFHLNTLSNPEHELQCVTTSKKLTYQKLQDDLFEKLYPNIRN